MSKLCTTFSGCFFFVVVFCCFCFGAFLREEKNFLKIEIHQFVFFCFYYLFVVQT